MEILKDLAYLIINNIFLNRRNLIIFFTVVFGLLSFTFFYNSLILLFLIVLGAVSLLHTPATRNFIGFELCTLVTIIAAIKFGALTGAIVGSVSVTLGLILGRHVGPGIFVSIIGFVLIAVLASLFGSGQIILTGVLLTVFYDLLIGFFYYFIGSNPSKILIFSLTHIGINYLLFTYLAPVMIAII